MAIDFTCPHCGHFSRIDEQFIGRTGPCTNCGQQITVPAPGSHTSAPVAAAGCSAIAIVGIIGGVFLVGMLIIGVLALLMLPALNAAREAARRNGCLNQGRQIGLALLTYEATYGSFPPAYIADENGTPMHSWRVLILPQLGYQHLYDQYNFDEPWDSPNNLAVAAMMPGEYSCPSDLDANTLQETSYMVLVGPETIFPAAESTRTRDLADGTSQTILLVEVADSAVGWTQPIDLNTSQIDWQINGAPGNSISSHHAGGVAMVVFADCHVVAIDATTSPQTLHDLSTRAGGEPTRAP